MAIPISCQLYDGNTQHPQIWPFQFAASFTTGIPNIHKNGHSNSLPALQREYPTSTNMAIPIRCELYDGNTQHPQIWPFQFATSFKAGISNIHKYGHSNSLPALQRQYPTSTNMAIPIRCQLYNGNTQHPQIWLFQFTASFTTPIPNIHKYGHSNSLPALQRQYPTSTNMAIPIRCQLYNGNTQHPQIWPFQFTASFTTGIPNIHKYGHSNSLPALRREYPTSSNMAIPIRCQLYNGNTQHPQIWPFQFAASFSTGIPNIHKYGHSNSLPALRREYPTSTNMAIPISCQIYDGNTQHPQIWPLQLTASFTTGIPNIHKYGHSK